MQNRTKETAKQRLLIWLNNLHFHINIQRKGKFFQVILHEKYKKVVRFLKIIFTLIGLFSAYYIFQSPSISFLFALVIFLIIQLSEKMIFAYTSLYVHSIPNFEFQSDKWAGAFFGYVETRDIRAQLPLVGWMFTDEELAKNIHSLLSDWTYGVMDDKDKNVKMSVILDENETGKHYIFFCYPSAERKTAKKFFDKIEKERKKISLTDVHNRFFLMSILGKSFKMPETSYLPTFIKRYRHGVPFMFRIAVTYEDIQSKQIDGLKDFIFHDLKIKNRSDLNRKDLEYDLLRIWD